MKLFVFWLAAVVAVASAVKQEVFKVSKERVHRMLNEYAKPCADKFNVDPIMVKKVTEATLPQDEATKNFVYCFARNAGYTDEEGRVSADRLADIVGDHPLLQELRESVRKCNELKGEDPAATIVLTATCIAVNAPIRFQL